MNIKGKSRIKILSIFMLIAILAVSFRIFVFKDNEKTSESIAETKVEANKTEDVNIAKLNEDNCEYKIKKNTTVITKYESDEDCIVLPTEIDGKKVKEIKKDAFEQCYNLETIKVPVELKEALTDIKDFEINEKNSDEEYIELKTTREYSEIYKYYVSLSEEEKEKSLIVPYKFEVSASEDTINVSDSDIPKKYDLREEILIETENQGSYGTCYAYAALTSLETWIARNTGELVDFSEIHAGVYSAGGAGIFKNVESYINSGYGPVWEADCDKDTYKNKVSASNYNMIDSYLKGTKYSDSQIEQMKNALTAQRIEIEIDTKTCTIDETIKEYVMKYGAVCSYYHHDNAYLAKDYNGYTVYNSSGINLPDHAVCIIGWDDNFLIDNFPLNIRPSKPGAFLVLNSWGTDWGTDGGCFWISYEDNWIGATGAVVTGVKSLNQNIKLNKTLYKDMETGKEVPTVNGIKNIINKGTKLGINVDLRDNSNNRLVSTSSMNVTLRNPEENINKSLTVEYKDGYNVIYVDTAELTPGAEYIIDIVCKGEQISKVIRIRDLYDYEIKDDKTIKLTSYNAKSFIDVTVPKTYNGYTVSELGSNLFYNNDEIETVTVYSTVKDIGTNLVQKGVILFGDRGSKLSNYAEINGYQFLEIGVYQIIGDFWNFNANTKTLTIIRSTGDYARISAPWEIFYKRIYNVKVKDGVEKIGARAFEEFTNLQSVTGLKNVTSIGEAAFADCINLSNIDKLPKLTTLGDFVFIGCESLEKIVIGKNVQTIEGSRVFTKTNVTIYGFEGTMIETYAKEKNIPFSYINITGIEIKSLPTKTIYVKGESLDLTGGTVIVFYEEGFEEEISMTNMIAGGYSTKEVGERRISVSYYGHIEYFTVTIKEISEIKFKKYPSKTKYIKGEELLLAGEKLVVTYSDGSTEEVTITKDMISGYDKTSLGSQNVSITYKNKNMIFPITVTNDITRLSIKELPSNLTYLLGEELDLKGGKLLVIYQNKETKEIDMTANGVTVTGYDKNVLGDQEIKVTYEGKSIKFYVRVIKDVSKIEIKEDPIKTTYIRGEEIDLAGGKILVTYTDNSTEVIDMTDGFVSVKDYDKTLLGYQEIKLVYEGFEISFYVKVTNDVIGIKIKENSLKTTYIKGEELDLTGGIILKIYQDKTTEEMPIIDENITISGYDKQLLGNQKIKVQYSIFSTEFTVDVINNITDIQIKEIPSKTTYVKGEEIDLAGGKILVTYQNGETKEIEMTDKEVQVTGYTKDVLGNQEVKVTYNGFETIFIVKVTNDMAGIQLEENPSKVTYVKGEELDLTGGKILVIYQNKETKEIEMTDKEVQVTGYNKEILGNQELKVTYNGFETTFIVKVTNDMIGIQVKENPSKITYVKGEELDLAGGKILVTYQNKETKEIEMTDKEVQVTGYNKETLGIQKITVTYLKYKVDISILVIEPKISAQLSISGESSIKAGETQSSKLTINAEGDYVEKVSAKLEVDDNITKIEIKEKNGWKVEYNEKTGEISASKPGGAKDEQIAEITYTVKDTAQQNINMSIKDVKFTTLENKNISGENTSNKVDINGKVEKVLERIKISSKPKKVNYKEGEEFNAKGMKVIAQYSDGTEKEIKDYICIPYGSLNKNTDHITILYTEGEVLETVECAIKVQKKVSVDNTTDNKNDNVNNTNSSTNNTNNNVNSNKVENKLPQENNITSLKETRIDTYLYITIIIILICIIILFIIKKYEKYKNI